MNYKNTLNKYLIINELDLLDKYKSLQLQKYKDDFNILNELFNNKKINLYIKDSNNIGTYKIEINYSNRQIKILGKSGEYYTEEDHYSKQIMILDSDDYLNFYYKNNIFIIIRNNEYIYITDNIIKKIILEEDEKYLHHIINFDFSNYKDKTYNLHYLITNKNIFILSENKVISNINFLKIINKIYSYLNIYNLNDSNNNSESNNKIKNNISLKSLINTLNISYNKIDKNIYSCLMYLNNVEEYNETFDDRELYQAHYEDSILRLNNYFYKHDNFMCKFYNYLLIDIYKHNLLFLSQKYLKKLNKSNVIILNEFKIKTQINNNSYCSVM